MIVSTLERESLRVLRTFYHADLAPMDGMNLAPSPGNEI